MMLRTNSHNSNHISKPTISIKGLRKSYGATMALENVNFDIYPGEVHALLGENGAGKSTLVKILSGVICSDSGHIELAGVSFRPNSINTARLAGVASAFQEISLLPNLSVAENLTLPTQPSNWAGLIDRPRCEKVAAQLLEQFDLHEIKTNTLICNLSLANRQRLEIARAMALKPILLILDEPTAVQPSTDWLFKQVRALTAQGTSVLYISHRLAEIRALCERGTVLRNGTSIATISLSEADDGNVFELMVGKKRLNRPSVNSVLQKKEDFPRLSVTNLCAGQIVDFSFNLYPKEILGVAGLDGQGQADLFHALFGLKTIDAGEIHVDGKLVKIKSPRDAMRKGVDIAFLPEERKTEGIFPFLTVQENVVIVHPSKTARAGIMRSTLGRNVMRIVSKRVDLAERYFNFYINDVSGGNQQKALLARTILSGARTLLLFDPTRGVDVGTKDSIYSAIREYAANGGSVMIYSSELSEFSLLCDRCLVIYNGRIVVDIDREAINETTMVAGITGHIQTIKSTV